MIDIHFYQRVHDLKMRLMSGERLPRQYVWDQFEFYRSRQPVVYNLETTNACNMRCRMCPRTTLMTRPVKTMELETAQRVIEQLTPWPADVWATWEKFVQEKYGVPKEAQSENNFFLYVIPKVLVLHGYGDPLLDPHIPEIVRMLTERGIPSYFSCNPANIDMKRTIQTFENGLAYIKYSIEAVDDMRHKKIRGDASNFWKSYRDIIHLLDLKAQRNWPVTIVITMLNLAKDDEDEKRQLEEYARLEEAFRDMDVYIYLKSQDQVWLENRPTRTKSIHWREFCQFPWSSMTISSAGLAVECVETFGGPGDVVLGDAKTQSLFEIWNGDAYRDLRKIHFDGAPHIKCTDACDMTLIGELL